MNPQREEYFVIRPFAFTVLGDWSTATYIDDVRVGRLRGTTGCDR
ncbi:hypothetical protein ACFFRL_02535 [Agromyces hippuratus]